MTEQAERNQPQYPTLEEFDAMSTDDKLRLWFNLPVPAQKLLIAVSSFAKEANPTMVQPVSQTNDEEFEEAKKVLSETPFFTQNDTGRLGVAQPMRQFINTGLRKFDEEQREARNNR